MKRSRSDFQSYCLVLCNCFLINIWWIGFRLHIFWTKFTMLWRNVESIYNTYMQLTFPQPSIMVKPTWWSFFRRKINFAQFKEAIKQMAAIKYPEDEEGCTKLTDAILQSKGPETHATVSVFVCLRSFSMKKMDITLDKIYWNNSIFDSDMWTLTDMLLYITPDSKVHGTNMGPTWVLSPPDGPHVGPMNLAIRGYYIRYNRYVD